MLLKMRLQQDSVNAMGTPLEFFQFSNFFTKCQYSLWLGWNFSGTVKIIKKRFGQGCKASKVLLQMRLQESAGQRDSTIILSSVIFSQNINIFGA